MNKLLITTCLVSALVAVGCPLTPVATPSVPTDSDRCGPACVHMKELQCPQGADIKMRSGAIVSCEQFCQDTQNQYVWLNPSCVEHITSCDQIESKCYVGRDRY